MTRFWFCFNPRQQKASCSWSDVNEGEFSSYLSPSPKHCSMTRYQPTVFHMVLILFNKSYFEAVSDSSLPFALS